MTPPTLKLPPRSGPAGPAKPPTSRQRRAQHGRAPSVALAPGHTLATPPATTDPPPRRKQPATVPRGKTGPEPALRRPPASTRSETPPAAHTVPRASVMPLVPENPRLSKRMSELGLCSRREADEWIENGWVKVDGAVTNTLGTRVAPEARIEIDAAARRHQSEQVTFLLHKPIGYVSGQAEDSYQPASVLIRPENRWPEDRAPITFKPSQLRGLAPAGRLDIDSTGLIVFTQDGRVARRLIGRDSEVEKEYLVRVEGTLSAAGMKQLQHGLELDGVKLKPARVSWQNEHQLRFVLREGRKRQIRRMCELVGLAVTGLKRVRTGSVVLGKLPVGQWRYLRADEKF
jgi:23S rRNA pseudouridine2604 synthase